MLARVRDRCRQEPPLAIVVVAVAIWIVEMYLNVWRRHDRFGTFDNDLGFHTQYVWLLARGKTFSTILGLPAFGHNATFGYYLFAPFSWMGAGPQFLDLVQTVLLGLGAIPVYILARRRLGAGWAAVALAFAYLLHPLTSGNAWETFHPEAMAITPLLCAYVAADGRRWGRFWIALFLAIIWKTDVALFVVMLGLLVALRWDRRRGLTAAAIGAVWFAVVIGIMIPSLSGGGTVFGPLYGNLGDDPAQVVGNSIVHPSRFVRHLTTANPTKYTRDLLAPYAFIPIAAPVVLLTGLPQYGISLLSYTTFTRDPVDNPHYQALPLVAMTIALVEGVAFISRRRPKLRQPVIATVAAFSLATGAAWSALPFGVRAHHFWSADGDPNRAAKERAVELPPSNDSVSAQYLLVPHLAERDAIYSFPNPWQKVFYGVDKTKAPDPKVVHWLVLDESVLSDNDKAVEQCILHSGAFHEVYRSGPIVVERRVDISGAPVADKACQS